MLKLGIQNSRLVTWEMGFKYHVWFLFRRSSWISKKGPIPSSGLRASRKNTTGMSIILVVDFLRQP